MMRPRRLLRLLPLLVPSLLCAQEDGVAISTMSDLSQFEEEIPVIGFTIERRGSTSGQTKKAAPKAPKPTQDKKVPVEPAAARAEGQWEAEGSHEAPPKPRRFMFVIGGSDEPIEEIILPPFPKGEDIPYDWDSRVILRLDGTVFRAHLRDRLGFKEFTMNLRLRFDPFDRTGLGQERDSVFGWVDRDAPVERRGYLIGFQGARNEWWGYSLDHDELSMKDEEGPVMDQLTTAGVGYSPLGANKKERWNYSLNGSVNYEDLDHTVDGVHKHEAGFGFGFGPTYRYGLEWVPIPGFTEGYRKAHKIKLTRFQTHLRYSDSDIHPPGISLSGDVVGYATRWLRLGAGLKQTYLPHSGKGNFSTKVRLDVIIRFAAVRF